MHRGTNQDVRLKFSDNFLNPVKRVAVRDVDDRVAVLQGFNDAADEALCALRGVVYGDQAIGAGGGSHGGGGGWTGLFGVERGRR
jgi:hypothetical protein